MIYILKYAKISEIQGYAAKYLRGFEEIFPDPDLFVQVICITVLKFINLDYFQQTMFFIFHINSG